MSALSPRRVVALVLPELLVELAVRRLSAARTRRARQHPLGVVLAEDLAGGSEPVLQPSSVLAQVNRLARRQGVAPGQTLVEAQALCSKLVVRALRRSEVETALAAVADVALGFGPLVAFRAPDTVWVDVTGSAQLWGGEATVVLELLGRVRQLGHSANIALAAGPELAAALARWLAPERQLAAERGAVVVSPEQSAEVATELPLAALPLPPELLTYFTRLGVLTLAEVSRLPRAQTVARLGEYAASVLDLCVGRDDTPLTPYRPAVTPSERVEWDEPIDGIEPLGFVLRGVCARLSARLGGRGEAAQRLALTLHYDRAIAELRGASPELKFALELPAALWRQEELWRVLNSKLARVELAAPTVALTLAAPAVVRALAQQLDLSRVVSQTTGSEALPSLIAELSADLGAGSVGVLEQVDSHLSEEQSVLVPVLATQKSAGKRSRRRRGGAQLPLSRVRRAGTERSPPTRVLPEPVPLSVSLRRGASLCFDQRLYTIESICFEERLDSVQWWTGRPIARDLVRVVLASADGVLEASVCVDPHSGARFLQALWD